MKQKKQDILNLYSSITLLRVELTFSNEDSSFTAAFDLGVFLK